MIIIKGRVVLPEAQTVLLPEPLRAGKWERNNLSEIECLRYVQSTGANSKGRPVQYRKRSLIRTKKRPCNVQGLLLNIGRETTRFPASYSSGRRAFRERRSFPPCSTFRSFTST